MMCVMGRPRAAFKIAWRWDGLCGPGSTTHICSVPTTYVFVPSPEKGPGLGAISSLIGFMSFGASRAYGTMDNTHRCDTG